MSKKTSTEQVRTPSVTIDPRYIGKLTGTLLGICVVVALLLAVVNMITEPIITQMQKQKTETAMAQVMPAESYEAVDFTAENVVAMYRAMRGGEQVGFVVEVKSSGFGGAMSLVVGVDMDGKVAGVAVTDHAETKNIGTKVADDPAVLGRFVGMDGTITVNSGTNRFDAISGATVTSKAVTAAVNTALTAVQSVREQGGGAA